MLSKTLLLLIFASFLVGSESAPLLNEVTSQEELISNDLLLQPLFAGAVYKPRHAHRKPPPPRLWSFLRSFYNLPGSLEIAPGGANYYSNEILPLSTYELIEPEEPIY